MVRPAARSRCQLLDSDGSTLEHRCRCGSRANCDVALFHSIRRHPSCDITSEHRLPLCASISIYTAESSRALIRRCLFNGLLLLLVLGLHGCHVRFITLSKCYGWIMFTWSCNLEKRLCLPGHLCEKPSLVSFDR